jgi:hypothetical protein
MDFVGKKKDVTSESVLEYPSANQRLAGKILPETQW